MFLCKIIFGLIFNFSTVILYVTSFFFHYWCRLPIHFQYLINIIPTIYYFVLFRYGTGQVMVRRYGIWHSKCYNTLNHTRAELENICRDLGFISGHAKQLYPPHTRSYNSLVIDVFSTVVLNNNTSIVIRNNDTPIAAPIVDDTLKDCYPVFIECL